MIDFQTLIDNIVAAIDMPDTPLDELRDYSQTYSEACTEINRRLALCGQFLRAGNIAEALRLGESTPPLLDICNVLDFPEKELWIDVCRSLHLTIAPNLIQQNIDQLNNAYTSYFELEDLLKKNRRLALLRAPIKSRLAVLRQLEEKEPHNIIWGDMLIVFEKERFMEMEDEFSNAIQQPEAIQRQQILALSQELNSKEWGNVPPENLVHKVRQWVQNYNYQQGLVQFRNFLSLMEKTYSEKDYEATCILLTQWNDTLQAKKISLQSLPSDILIPYKKITGWIGEVNVLKKKERETANRLTMFEKALVTESDIEVLMTEHNALASIYYKLGQTMPPYVEEAYQARIHKFEAEGVFKKKLIFIGMICLAILFLIIAGIVVFAYFKHSRLKSELGRVQTFIAEYSEYQSNGNGDENAITNAEKVIQNLEKLDPKNDRITAIRREIETLKDMEKKRQTDLTSAIKDVEDSIPNDTSIPSNTNKMSLDKATQLVRTQEEKEIVKNLTVKFEKIVLLQHEKFKNELDEAGKRLKVKIDNIKNDNKTKPEELLLSEPAIRNSINGLNAFDWKVRDETVVLQKELNKTLDDCMTILKNEVEIRKTLSRVTAKIGDYAGFEVEIKNIKENISGSLLTKKYDQFIKNYPLVKKVEAWNIFSKQYRTCYEQLGNDPLKVEIYKNALNQIKSEAPMIPELAILLKDVNVFDDLVKYGGRQKINQDLNLFLSKYKTPLWFFEKTNTIQNAFYYFTKNTSRDTFVSFGNMGVIPDNPFLLELTEEEMKKLEPAPHQVACVDIIDQLDPMLSKDFSAIHWYRFIADSLMKFNPHQVDKMDSVVKVFFLQNLLNIIEKDPLLSRYFNLTADDLEDPRMQNDIDWYNPHLDTLPEQRELSKSLLKKVQNFDEIFKPLYQEFTNRINPIRTTYDWIGYLRFFNNIWSVELSDKVVPFDGTVYICLILESGTGIQFQSLQVRGRELVHLDKKVEGQMIPGLPVFKRQLETKEE